MQTIATSYFWTVPRLHAAVKIAAFIPLPWFSIRVGGFLSSSGGATAERIPNILRFAS